MYVCLYFAYVTRDYITRVGIFFDNGDNRDGDDYYLYANLIEFVDVFICQDYK